MESYDQSPRPVSRRKKFRTDCNGKWAIDPDFLLDSLVNGNMKLSDDYLQSVFLDYMENQEYMCLYNQDDGNELYIAVPKRGNYQYAKNKGAQRDSIDRAMSDIRFSFPVPGFRSKRKTHILFTTVTFDQSRFTPEEAWASLKSTRPEGCDHQYNVLNNLGARIEKVFGKYGKLTSKEGQANLYPAPHLLIILEEPVVVKRTKIKGDLVRWFIDDPDILRRIGKDPKSRKRYRQDYKSAIEENPFWNLGFYDIEGVVCDSKFKGRKSVLSYIYKYLSKCLTRDHSALTRDIMTINDVKDHDLKVALLTDYCNKCFRNRDITYGKKFKEMIGLLAEKKEEDEEKEPSSWIFMGIIDEETYESVKLSKINEKLEELGLNPID